MRWGSVVPTDKPRNFDRQMARVGGVPTAPESDLRTRLKVYGQDISGGQSGEAYLMVPVGTSPFFTASTIIVPLYVPVGANLSEDDEVWAEWLPRGETFMLLNAAAAAGAGGRVAVTDTIIPGRNGKTPGGPISVQPQKIGDDGDFEDDGSEVNVYSWVKTASADPANEDEGLLWIWIELGYTDGLWYFTAQDCTEEEQSQ